MNQELTIILRNDEEELYVHVVDKEESLEVTITNTVGEENVPIPPEYTSAVLMAVRDKVNEALFTLAQAADAEAGTNLVLPPVKKIIISD